MTLRRLLLILAAVAVGGWPIAAGDPWSSMQAQGQPATPAQGRQGGAPQAAARRRRNHCRAGATPRRRLGPFNRLVIRNVMVIDGTGAPPIGPDERRSCRATASPAFAAPARPACRSARAARRGGAAADHEIDGTGMYLMPGFVDLHVHAGGPPKNAEAEYAYKLWLAHGVTTVRGVVARRRTSSPSARRRAARRTRSSRRASSTTSGPGGTELARRPRARGCGRTRKTASTA